MAGPTNGGRSRSLRALRESDELHRIVLSNISDAVFLTDSDGHFTFVCPNVDVIFGFAPDEVHAMGGIDKLLGESLFDPNRLAAEGEIPNVEREITTKCGTRRTVLVQIKKVSIESGTVLYACRDITERKLAEASARESEDRFRVMANHAPVLLWMSDFDKLCSFFNQGWLTFTGRGLAQEIGNGWAEGVHPDDMRRCLETYLSAFDARQPFKMEYRLRRHDGEYRWILDAGVPRFAADGEFVGYVGSAIDISDQKQIEESSRRLAHLHRLAAAGELTAAIAHELRQPLTSIVSNVDVAARLLESANPPLDELREIISDIRVADGRANEILTRIRDFTRKRDTQREALDINSAIADTVRLVAGDAQRKRVQIRAELAPGLPLVSGDRTQLQQVLINLAINGIDAMASTPEPARSLTVQTRSGSSDHVEVAIADHGHGIAPDILPRIFDAFFTTKGDGMGLGLSLARSIVESHNGRIWADNNDSGGATFRFTVPVPPKL
jgi:PAS domain S-box-containing protein